MNGNCHFLYGGAVGSVVALNLSGISTVLPAVVDSPENATLFVLGGLIGSIFPDIDNSGSYMGKLSAPVSTVLCAIGGKMGKSGYNHRGILHDPIVYLLGLVLCYLYFTPMIGFFIGCLSHLFLDMFNPKGVPIGPFRRVSIGNFKSGEIGSVILTWVCVFVVLTVGILVRYL